MRTGLVYERQVPVLRLLGPGQIVDAALARTDIANGCGASPAWLTGHGDGILVDVDADDQGGARVIHGCPSGSLA
jgi:hypothetical protein